MSRNRLGEENELTEHLDLRGKVCPYPTTEVLDTLKRVPSGTTLEVVSDYMPARYTIPAMVTDLGYTHDLRENGDGTFTITIEKTDPTDSG
jgi:tRNA 2-thiouridine synthesizing protein A